MSDDSHYPDIDDYDDSVAGDWLCLNSAGYRTYQCQPSPLAKLSTSQVVNFQLKLGGGAKLSALTLIIGQISLLRTQQAKLPRSL